MVSYCIHTPAGLTAEEAKKASEFGPTEVLAEAPPGGLARAAGFDVLVEVDVTVEFRATCAAILRARGKLERELRREEGNRIFEEEQQKKRLMLRGLSEGLLRRSLVVACRI